MLCFSSRTRALGLSAAAMLSVSSLATAQEAAAPENQVASANDGSGSAVEAVIVTARRRNEDVQEVPIPMTALSGEALESKGLFRFEDLNHQLPSTNIQFVNPLQTSIAIRGLGTGPANNGLTSSVGVYLDNVYLGRAGMANQDLIDIDQIALLRGPQGTLFGKNTTAGVLNIQTLQPTFTPTGKAEASYGSQSEHGNYYQVRGTYSGPITESLAGRISFAKTERDGHVKNLYDGKYTNGSDRIGARGQLLFKPGDNLSLRIIADYHEEDSPCCHGILYSPGPNDGSLFFSRVAAVGAQAVLDSDYRSAQFNTEQRIQVRQGGGSVEANWSLGDYALTSITAYRNWWFKPTNDPDNLTISAIKNAGQLVDNDQWSQELRIASPDGEKIEWVAGLFYFYQYQNNVQYTEYGPDAGAYLGSPILSNGSSYLHTYYHKDSYAAFAQATWHATDHWSVTAGLRQTSEKNTARVRREGYGVSGFVAAFGERSQDELSKKDNDLSALLSVDYKVTDDVLAYASVSRGAKAGGINAIFPTGGLTTDSLLIDPEEATDVELGFKSTLWDRRLTWNSNLYWTRVKDYQSPQLLFPSPGVSVQVLANVGLVRTRGVETELSAEPIDGLTVALAASFNDATYQSYKDAPCSAEAAAAGATVCDLTGERVVGAPRWVLNPSVAYTNAVSASLDGYVRADYAWRSSFSGSVDNSELAKVDGYGLLNLRLGLTGKAGDNQWDASLWATNLLDKNYVLGGVGQMTYRTYYMWSGQPRLIGATFRLSF